ncbi:hypothetical protein LUZ60_016014 [Juncus effusus]|nr:hypothetical protein LUZ60_016014 [Juncus effusus]
MSPSFPFLALPSDLQSKILSLLPVSALVPLLTLSRSVHSLLTSPTFPSPPPDLFFLLFSSQIHSQPSLLSFHPATNKWFSLPLPSASPLAVSRPFATSACLAVTGGKDEEKEGSSGEMFAVRMFSKSRCSKRIPPMIRIGDLYNPYVNPYVLAVLPGDEVEVGRSRPSEHFKILAVSNCKDGVFPQVYDSRKGKWIRTGKITYRFILLGNTTILNNSLFVHAYMPDQLLQFDLISQEWKVLLPMPQYMMSSHIFSYNNKLYLIAGLEEFVVITTIRVWELDWDGKMEWREISSLTGTDEEFVGFTGGSSWLFHFEAVDRVGLVCLYNSKSGRVLMFDARAMSWRLVPECELVPKSERKWYGHATEMGLEVLRDDEWFVNCEYVNVK